jgi:uncharacterized repeat protein (TIGR01451 family)
MVLSTVRPAKLSLCSALFPFLCIVSVCGSASQARAGVHLFSATDDTWLEEAAPSEVHGWEDTLRGRNQEGDNKRPAIRFDLSSLPRGATIVQATLAVSVKSTDDSGSPVLVHRITRGWTESVADWDLIGTEFDSMTVYGTFTPDTNGPLSVDVTGLVQEWQGSIVPNHGLLLRPTSEGNETEYWARQGETERGADEQGPRLIIETSEHADIAVGKIASHELIAEGDSVLFTITAKNHGPMGATEVVLWDQVPFGLSYVTNSRTQGFYDPGLGLWWVGSLDVGATATLGLLARANPGTGGSTVTNIAQRTQSSPMDTVVVNDQAWASVFIVPEGSTNLRLMKTVDDSIRTPGEDALFTVEVMNHGPKDAAGIEVLDQLPLGLRYSYDEPSQGTYDDVTGLWSVGALKAGHSASLLLSATVEEGTEGMWLVNGASIIRIGSPEVDDSDNADSAGVLVPLADLAVTKYVDTPNPAEGDSVKFTVDLRNLGPTLSYGIEVKDVLPDGLTFAYASASQGTFDDSSSAWDPGILEAGSPSVFLRIVATVDSGTGGSTLVNVATISGSEVADPESSNDEDEASVTVQSADLSLAKTVTDENPREGDSVGYEVLLTNEGPNAADGVTVHDLLPAGVLLLSAGADRGSWDEVTGIWDVGPLGVGESVRLDIDVLVDTGTGGSTITNTATISGSSQPDPFAGNDVASVDLVVQSADLAVTKTAGNSSPNVGETFTYNVTVENLGPNDAGGVVVADSLPAGVTWVSDIPTRGSYDRDTGLWTIGTLDSATVESLAVLVSVDPGAGGATIVNRAGFSARDLHDPVATNDTTSAAVTVPLSDLAVQKSVDDPAPSVGQPVTFTVAVTNEGPDEATGVQVTDVVPAGLVFQSGVAFPGTYVDSTGRWDVGSIAPADTATLFLSCVVDNGTAGQHIENVATITAADQADPDLGNNADSAAVDVSTVIVLDRADLGVTKSVDVPNPKEGDPIRYTVTVTNFGPDPATGVEITDVLPGGVSFALATPTQGIYEPASGLWTVGAVPVLASATILLDATVDGGTGGTSIVNTATVTASSAMDLNVINNTGTAEILVQSADLAVSESADPVDPDEGDTVTFSILLRNTGPDDAAGVEVSAACPAGFLYQSATYGQGSYDDGSGVWTVGGVTAGDSLALALTGTIDTGTGGTTLVHVAAIAATDQGDPDSSNDVDSSAVTVRTADLRTWKIADDVAPVEGGKVHFTVTLANDGPDSSRGILATDILPPGLTLEAALPGQGGYVDSTGEWTVGALAPAESTTLVLETIVDAGTGGTALTNVASISGAITHDPDPSNHADSAVVNVQMPTGVTVLASQPTATAHPGASEIHLMSVALANSDPQTYVVQSLLFENTTSGPGNQNQLDAELGSVSLWRDDGDGAFETRDDTLIDIAAALGGEVTFPSVGESLPSGALLSFHLATTLPPAARDGDALDLAIAGPASVVLDLPALFLNPWPVAPPGEVIVDGMSSAQITMTNVPSGGVGAGASGVLAMDAVLPGNGYVTDTLQEVRIVNRGTAGPADIAAVEIWRDDGDGAFGGDAGDVFLGPAAWNGSLWKLVGMSTALPPAGRRFFVSIDVDSAAVPGRTIRLGFESPSSTGIVVASGNDGPLDAAVGNSGTMTILPPPGTIAVSAGVQTGGDLLPGADPEEILRVWLVNVSAVAETLRTFTLTNATTGAGTPAQLDADWQDLTMLQFIQSNVGGTDGDAPLPAPTTFVDGRAVFGGLDTRIAPADTVTLILKSGASLGARDGDVLDVTVADDGAFTFSRTINVTGSWPLDPPGSFPVDGMSAKQVGIEDLGGTNLQTGTSRNVALTVLVPANGYEDDVLTRLDVLNLGSAEQGDDLSRLEAWHDDGDGAFDEGVDTLLGEMAFTGDRWEMTGLSLPVSAEEGVRIFVTCDVADLAGVGRTVHLAVPGPPDPGIGVASGNDGPVDATVIGPTTQTISTVDRVTLSAVTLESGTVPPGRDDALLLQVAWDNTYLIDKTLTSLEIANRTEGSGSVAELDAEIVRAVLHGDDGDGVPEPGGDDSTLGVATFVNGAASFTDLDYLITAGASGMLFVTGDVSLSGAADGDRLGVDIAGPPALGFADPTSLAADWPLDSGGRQTVDGMVALQIGRFDAPQATLGPNEGPVSALDLAFPGNGYAADVLTGLLVENLGTALPADLSDVRLWRDGGDGTFDAGGDDTDLGALAPVGDRWSHPLLHTAIPPGGARFFVAVTSSATPTDSSTVRLSIPVAGITVESGNDGPLDESVANTNSILLSTAALLASLTIDPPASTIDQIVAVRLTARNDGDSTITGITPSALVPSGLGVLELLTGPVPASFDLASGAESTFTWDYRAASSGPVRLSGSVSGLEAGVGPPRQSLEATSNQHQVFVAANEVELFAVESMPFSISRGQQDVVPLTLTFANPGGVGGSAVRVLGLRLQISEEGGGGVVPADLLSRVVVKEGSVVYLEKTALETSGDEVDLTLATPLLVESDDPPGGQATLNLSLDIADSTTVGTFRVRVVDETWVTVDDATSGAPVIALLQGDSWPISSGLARIVAEATQLDVASVTSGARTGAQGQSDVTLLTLDLLNPDPYELASDVRLSRFDVDIVDGVGVGIADPRTRLDRIRVRGPVQEILLDRAVGGDDDSTLTLSLSPFVSCPVNTPVRIEVLGAIADSAMLGMFRLQLSDSAAVDARDANTGAPVDVILTPSPALGDPVTVERPATSILVAGTPSMPGAVLVGETDIQPMSLVLSHPGGIGTSAIRCDELAWRLRNERDEPLVPRTFLDRVRVLRGAEVLGELTDLPASGDGFVVPIPGMTVGAQAAESLTVQVDLEATAPAGFLEMVLPAAGVVTIDSNLGTPVPALPDSGNEFPLSSGLTRLESPPRELEVGFESSMPPVLAADGREVPTLRLRLGNPAPATSGEILVTHVDLRAADRDGFEYPLGAVATRLTAVLDGESRGETGPLDPLDIKGRISFPDTLRLPPGDPVELEIRMTTREGSDVSSVRLGCDADGMGVVPPQSALLAVSVEAEAGLAFPFWSQAGNFSGVTLAESWSNFPNPFPAGRGVTTFAFYLPSDGRVTLRLLSLRGEKVLTILEDEPRVAGLHQDTTWDGRNGRGAVVVNGVYLAEIEVRYGDGASERHLRKVAVVR